MKNPTCEGQRKPQAWPRLLSAFRSAACRYGFFVVVVTLLTVVGVVFVVVAVVLTVVGVVFAVVTVDWTVVAVDGFNVVAGLFVDELHAPSPTRVRDARHTAVRFLFMSSPCHNGATIGRRDSHLQLCWNVRVINGRRAPGPLRLAGTLEVCSDASSSALQEIQRFLKWCHST